MNLRKCFDASDVGLFRQGKKGAGLSTRCTCWLFGMCYGCVNSYIAIFLE
jgi:hypothetical protein